MTHASAGAVAIPAAHGPGQCELASPLQRDREVPAVSPPAPNALRALFAGNATATLKAPLALELVCSFALQVARVGPCVAKASIAPGRAKRHEPKKAPPG